MSDEDYLAFLEKANKNPSEGAVAETKMGGGKQVFKTTEEGAEVPKVLREAVKDQWYSSDADERFEGVALGLPGGRDRLPDEGEFTFFPFFLGRNRWRQIKGELIWELDVWEECLYSVLVWWGGLYLGIRCTALKEV